MQVKLTPMLSTSTTGPVYVYCFIDPVRWRSLTLRSTERSDRVHHSHELPAPPCREREANLECWHAYNKSVLWHTDQQVPELTIN